MKKIALASATVFLMSAATIMAQNKPEALIAVESAPGVLKVAQGSQFQGKFKSINPATRSVVVVAPNGTEFTTVLGNEVQNFNQIKVGDLVTLTQVEILVVDIKKPAKVEIREQVITEKAAQAKPGQKPASGIERQVKVVADVTAVDTKKGILTIRGATRTLELKVNNPNALKDIKVGTQIEAVITEVITIQVTAPTK